MQLAQPPYALPTLAFPFRHLATLAGRAPIGGAREVALACFVAARLAADRAEPHGLPEAGVAARVTGARAWVGTLALPAPVRQPLARCLDRCAGAARAAVGADITALARAADEWLDAGARAELDALAGVLGR